MDQRARKARALIRRGLSFGRSALEANYRDLPLPYRLFIQLSNQCNCRCKTCAIWQKPTDGELTTSELLEVLRQAAPFIKWMDFTGGEIFLRPDLETLLHFVAFEMPNLFMFHFATNGSMPDRVERGARIIRRSSIPRFIVTVSLDGPEALHNSLRGMPGIFARALETFRRLRDQSVAVVFGMTLSELNRGQFFPTLEAVRKVLPWVEPADFHINLVQISDLYYANRGLIEAPSQQLLSEVDAIVRSRKQMPGPVQWLEQGYLREASVYLEGGRTPLPCEALSSSVVLSPTGEVFPCIFFEESVGNVRSSGLSIEALCRSSRKRAIREEVKAERCPHCWTPCEAYQTLIANSMPLGKNRK